MSALLVLRRLHLYLGLVLLPWVVLFGVTSWPFSHPVPVQPTWTVRLDGPFTLKAPVDTDLRTLGARLHEAAGFGGGFYVNRPSPQRINVYHPNFVHPTRITYFVDQQRLLVEEREFVLRQALTSMHAHGGYELGGFWNVLWAIVVDVFCVALIVWIGTGLVMWWMLPGRRAWGWIALTSGLVVFVVLVARL